MKNLFLLIISLLLSHYSYGQTELYHAVGSIFAEWNKTDVPGGAVGIIKDGKMVYARGYGMADLEHDIVIDPSSVFYIGSVSKQFVTFCILLLEEQGKLDLDDKIQKFLPDFPEYEAPLTVRNFIHHTSGVRDYLTLMSLKGRSYLDHIEDEEVYELIKQQEELNFKPGDRYLYSNSCYFMLAMIVEKVAGQSIKAFAQEHIFGPLGMYDTQFYDDITQMIKNRVFSYQKNEAGFDNLVSRFDLVGSGGVYSTIEDLYLWDQNFYDNKLGKGGQAIIEKMHEEGLLNNGESTGYAFALQNGTYKGLKTVSHGGALAGYRAHYLRFPDQQFSVIILSNRDDGDPGGKSYQVADLFLKDQLKEEKPVHQSEKKTPVKTVELSQVILEQYVGHYQIEPGVKLIVDLNNMELEVLQTWNNLSYPIYPSDKSTFRIEHEANVIFEFSKIENGKTQMLTIQQNGVKTKCKRIKAIDFSSIDLEDYSGKYYSKELNAIYQLFVEDGTLMVRIGNKPPTELTVTDVDQFMVKEGGVVLQFSRGAERVEGFTVDAGRVQHLKFVRQ